MKLRRVVVALACAAALVATAPASAATAAESVPDNTNTAAHETGHANGGGH